MTEEKSQASFAQKVKLMEGTCYQCGKPGHILPDCPEAAYTPKDKWEFKTATQHLCATLQKVQWQSEKKTQ